MAEKWPGHAPAPRDALGPQMSGNTLASTGTPRDTQACNKQTGRRAAHGHACAQAFRQHVSYPRGSFRAEEG